MQTVLFHETVFGPIHSRRLGTSLGVNLSPVDGKVCSFDCLYCEAGYNAQGPGKAGLPTRCEVARLLEAKLRTMHEEGLRPDVITFSGNGEPTLHPDFPGIVDDTLRLRDAYCPEAKVSVLTNSTQLHRTDIVEALRRTDNPILKLDSAIESTMRALDRPAAAAFTVEHVVDKLAEFGPKAIVQTLLTRGSHGRQHIDNTTAEEIDALIGAYRRIAPREIMLYTIDRRTPEQSLQRIARDELDKAAARVVAATGIEVQVSG